jgi:GNAT superfamily N-acetyltransferase
MTVVLVPLSKKLSVKDFDCGNRELNDYLKHYALKNDLLMMGKTFVALTEENYTIGYFTLSNAQIERTAIPVQTGKKLPRYPIPAVRISRLAIDRTVQGRGIGAWMLIRALEKALQVSEVSGGEPRSVGARRANSGNYAVLVDAIDEKAKAFYLKYGFLPLNNQSLSLFLPMETIKKELYDRNYHGNQ